MVSLIALVAIGFWMNISEKGQEKSFEQDDTVSEENQYQNGGQLDLFSIKDADLGEFIRLIGSSKKEIQKKLGDPSRIDASGYGFIIKIRKGMSKLEWSTERSSPFM